MILFTVPYEPYQGTWSVRSNYSAYRQDCESRTEALRLAIGGAFEKEKSGEEAMVCIEGADGRWRQFDHEFRSVV